MAYALAFFLDGFVGFPVKTNKVWGLTVLSRQCCTHWSSLLCSAPYTAKKRKRKKRRSVNTRHTMHSSQLQTWNLLFPGKWALCISINSGSVLLSRKREASIELALSNTQLSCAEEFFFCEVFFLLWWEMEVGRGTGERARFSWSSLWLGKLQAGRLQLHLLSTSKNQSDSLLASAFKLYFPWIASSG